MNARKAAMVTSLKTKRKGKVDPLKGQKRYTPEFRMKVAKESFAIGRAEGASKFGVAIQTLDKWRQDYKKAAKPKRLIARRNGHVNGTGDISQRAGELLMEMIQVAVDNRLSRSKMVLSE